MKKRFRRLKHYLVPHAGNGYRPHLFSREIVGSIALVLLLIEGAYLFQVNVILPNTGFTATILPAALTSLANADRSTGGLSDLTVDPLLSEAAQAKADDMSAKSYFAHVAPDGTTFRTLLDRAGYPYSYAGENLAVDFSESSDVESAWMNSPTHRANILKGEYTHVGFGIAEGMYEGKEVTFVAQFFAAKRVPSVSPAVAVAPRNEPEVPAAEPVVIANTDTGEVLGTETESQLETAAGDVAVLATSPAKTVGYLVFAFTAFVAVIFTLTVFMHMRNRYIYREVIVGGLFILAIGIGILFYNGSGSEGSVPTGSQSASVSLAL